MKITHRDDKTGRIKPNYTKEQFNFLVSLMRFAEARAPYDYLDQLGIKDPRTRQGLIDKAMQKARELHP